MSTSSLVSAPLSLWNLYVEHLWDYKAGSWVQRTASTSRILALIAVTPFIILTLLDVASYVIARTLGVVDSTKASTGGILVEENGKIHEPQTPAIQVLDASPNHSRSDFGGTDTPTPSYFRDNVVEEGNPRLAGVGAFSPAPSQPPSPTLSRRDLVRDGKHLLQPMTDLSGNMGRKRSNTSGSNGQGIGTESSMRRRGRDAGESD